MQKVRSFIFNIVFYFWTFFVCLLLLPAMILPRKWVNTLVKYVWSYPICLFEKLILNLTYEIVGHENVPDQGPYIFASKHQSAWETVKLHILFEDPAIILKKELQYIPLFGWFTWKTGMIGVRRGKRGLAISSMLKGARKVAEDKRSLVIFPQGTRTAVGAKQKYKRGIASLYTDLNQDIIPVALNSGVFWGRKSFLKHPGKITVEFLPPIPAGLPADEMMRRLEDAIETTSAKLEAQALESLNPTAEQNIATEQA